MGYGRRPVDYYGPETVHDNCPRRQDHENKVFAQALGEAGCLNRLGCRGQETHSDCPIRKWNSAAQGESGVNWCIGAGNPCHGCTEPSFSAGRAPFYTLEASVAGKK